MRLLVTGGAGYIGSVTAELLLREGHEVTVLDDLSTGHPDAVPEGARLLQRSLLDASPGAGGRLAADLEGHDAVLHFAALSLVGDSMRQPMRYVRSNVTGAAALLEAMVEAGVRRLVVSSTAACYGDPARVPIAEDDPAVPTNPYGVSKLAVDRMVAAAAEAYGLGAVSLRYFNVAGATAQRGERHDPETHLIPLVLDAAASLRPAISVYGTDYPTPDGTAIRDYIHVEDLAAAHLAALAATEEGAAAGPGRHRVFNLGNGEGFSVRQVIAAAEEVTRLRIPVDEAPRRPGDPAVLVASSERARTELGWRPRKPGLQEIVADAWAWHRRTRGVPPAGAPPGGTPLQAADTALRRSHA